MDNIRKQLKNQLFGHKNGPRIRKSIDIEEVIQEQPTRSNIASFKDHYILLEKIGEGAHSTVYRCQKIPKTQSSKSLSFQGTYAVKCTRTDESEIINTVIRTFNLQRTLHDVPQVCRAYDLFIDERTNFHYQVIEYCDWRSLQECMHILTLSEKREIIRQLAQVVGVMHSKGVSHRDLKPDNILVTVDPVQIKLIDFGVSKRYRIKALINDMWTRTGTILYQAPEVFYGGGYDEKIDVWAIGVILYQLLCGVLPFYAETISDTIDLITQEEQTYMNSVEFQALSTLERDLIKRVLKPCPIIRLSAQDIPLHPWFDQGLQSVGECFDDSFIQEDVQILERTRSTQVGLKYQNQENFQNLMESYEWGQRIHYKN